VVYTEQEVRVLIALVYREAGMIYALQAWLMEAISVCVNRLTLEGAGAPPGWGGHTHWHVCD